MLKIAAVRLSKLRQQTTVNNSNDNHPAAIGSNNQQQIAAIGSNSKQ